MRVVQVELLDHQGSQHQCALRGARAAVDDQPGIALALGAEAGGWEVHQVGMAGGSGRVPGIGPSSAPGWRGLSKTAAIIGQPCT